MNMKVDFDPGPGVGFDSFLLNIFPKSKSENCEPYDMSDDIPYGMLRLKIMVDGRKYKHYGKRMKEV